jgi:hypothetical protein
MTRRTIIGAFILGAAVTLTASAEASVDSRQREQRQRIQQGVRSGELTAREAVRLTREQQHIRGEEYRYRHDDGRLDRRERADLWRDQNRASRHIRHQKHDRQN